MDKLTRLLLGKDEPKKRQIDNFGLDTMLISEYAYEKAFAYARLNCKHFRDSKIECGGYLICDKDSDDLIATDAFLARDQDVSRGLFTIKPKDVIKAGRELDKNGKKILGWWHSHGKMDTFFSKLDEIGQWTVLNEISPTTYIDSERSDIIDNLSIYSEDGKIIIMDSKKKRIKFEIETSEDISNLVLPNAKKITRKKIGFAYGLVVNDQGKDSKPYAEIAVRENCYECHAPKDISYPVNVEIVKCVEYELDEDLLKSEIKDRVKQKFWNKLLWPEPAKKEEDPNHDGYYGMKGNDGK